MPSHSACKPLLHVLLHVPLHILLHVPLHACTAACAAACTVTCVACAAACTATYAVAARKIINYTPVHSLVVAARLWEGTCMSQLLMAVECVCTCIHACG